MRRRRKYQRGGSTLIEFVLVGVPIIFVMFSTAEVARAMWLYHTLAYAIREGTRYAIVHGSGCSTAPNSCAATIGTIASRIQTVGVGLDQNKLNLTFTPNTGSASTCTLANCVTNATVWPPSSANSPGMNLTISATYPFASVISIFWTGTGGGVGPFQPVNFPALSKDIIQF